MRKNSAKQLVYKYKVNIGTETGNYQWKELLLNIFQIQLIQVEMKHNHNLICVQWRTMNNMHVIHMLT